MKIKIILGLGVAAVLIPAFYAATRHQNAAEVNQAHEVPSDLRDAPNDSFDTGLPPIKFKAGKKDESAVVGVPVSPAAKNSVDLSGQFIDASGDRDQEDIGDCHDFGSIGVLEAAYFRKYHTYIRLSEADLFLQGTVHSMDFYQGVCSVKKHSNGLLEVKKFQESGWEDRDLRFALDHGVATAPQYSTFHTKYIAMSEADLKTICGLIADYKADYKKDTFLARTAFKVMYGSPEQYWAGLQERPEAKRLTDAYLAGKDPNGTLQMQRDEMKAAFTGFKLERTVFPWLDDNDSDAVALQKFQKIEKSSPTAQLRAGTAQKDCLLAQLGAGRPVVVSMVLNGMPAWDADDLPYPDELAGHAFDIVGYSTDSKGSIVFHTRNSWGGLNPDIPVGDLWRIMDIVTILTPDEAPLAQRAD